MMLDRLEGNEALKEEVSRMLSGRRLSHSLLLIGEQGLGAGFAARCIAADYLYPAGGSAAEALLQGECCRAVAKAGDRDSGRVETGVVREAIAVEGMGAGGRYLVGQVTAMRSEIFNTSLSAEGRAVLLYHAEKMNGESANALLKVMEEPPEGVLFLLTAQSLAGVLPTIRSRCVSFALAPAPVPQCAAFCAARGVPKRTPPACRSCSRGGSARCWPPPGTPPAAGSWMPRRTWPKRPPPATPMQPRPCWPGTKRTQAAAAVLLRDLCAYAAAGLRGVEGLPAAGGGGSPGHPAGHRGPLAAGAAGEHQDRPAGAGREPEKKATLPATHRTPSRRLRYARTRVLCWGITLGVRRNHVQVSGAAPAGL